MEDKERELSFKEIVDAHQSKVINICYRFTSNVQDAEDISQDVFIEVYHSLDKFRAEASLSTWIYRIAVNKSLDFIKSKKRKKRFSFGKQTDSDELDNLPSDSPDPSAQIDDNTRRKFLAKALDDLPDKQRTAITLNKFENMSNSEIAGIMKIKVNAVDALLHRARQNLQKKLEKYYKNYFK